MSTTLFSASAYCLNYSVLATISGIFNYSFLSFLISAILDGISEQQQLTLLLANFYYKS